MSKETRKEQHNSLKQRKIIQKMRDSAVDRDIVGIYWGSIELFIEQISDNTGTRAFTGRDINTFMNSLFDMELDKQVINGRSADNDDKIVQLQKWKQSFRKK